MTNSKRVNNEVKAMQVTKGSKSLSANQIALIFFSVLTVIAIIVA